MRLTLRRLAASVLQIHGPARSGDEDRLVVADDAQAGVPLMRSLAAFTLLLTGCTANRPGGGVDYDEPLWIAAYHDAWAEERPLPSRDECPAAYDLRIAELPLEDVRAWCCRGYYSMEQCPRLESCGAAQQDLIPFRTYLMVVADEDAEEPLAYLAGHEVLHVVRGCWAGDRDAPDRLARFDRGVPEDEHVSYPYDPRHLDQELWRRNGTDTIEADAQQRLELQ